MQKNQPASDAVGAVAENRGKTGMIAGMVGIAVNAAIFLLEICVGMVTNSIAITADAFHNLTDVVSSGITILSFRLANKPADKEHPFGHGRIEYLSTLIVAFIIMLIGYQFLQSSVQKILHPSRVLFSAVSLILILVAIPAKILLSLFIRRLGRRINSSTLKATSVDALSDVFILAVASISLIAAAVTQVPLDGYLGIVVALFIMYSGFSIARSALNPLLGEPPDPQMVHEIVADLLTFPNITGVHDLVMHNYGPGRFMASLHAEVPCDIPVIELHESIDAAEKQLSKKYGIFLVIHMDPLNDNDEEVRADKKELLSVLKSFKAVLSMHDFRVVGQNDFKNFIFDVVVENNLIRSSSDEEKLCRDIDAALKDLHPHYNAVVSIDRNYVDV